MKAALTIQIPEPCRQSWDEMTPETGGRHCAACAQTVTDFTRMSDAQILEVLRNKAVECGRFRDDQLRRELIALPAGRQFSLASFCKLAASLLFVFSAGKAAAQGRISSVPAQEASPRAFSWLSRLEGTVTDFEGNPLPDATVQIQGTMINAVTNLNGFYWLLVEKKGEVQSKELQLSFFYPGHTTIIVEKVPAIADKTTIVGTVLLMPFTKKDSLLLLQNLVPTTRYVYTKPLIESRKPFPTTLTAENIEMMARRDSEAVLNRIKQEPPPWRAPTSNVCGPQRNNTVYIIDGVLQTGTSVTLPKPKKWWQFWKRP